MMKTAPLRLILCILVLSLLSRAECPAADQVRVTVTLLPQAYFVERVAGPHAMVNVLIPKGASPETYEPTPQQLIALSESRLYIKVGAPGLPLEEKHLKTAAGRNRQLRIVSMSEGMTYREGDPHVWTSLIAARLAARHIAAALTDCDPAHGEEFQKNLRVLLADIDSLDREIRRAIGPMRGAAFMVYHPAWGYFADEYGLIQLTVEEEGKPVNAAHIRRMVDLARAKGIRSLIVQKGFDAKSARAIAREIGGRVVEADPLDRDWLQGMKSFTALLTAALRK
ncbi:MAG: metal ABC transporter solute-binding protein, Zn/Mn family [Syntrophales bacterium]